VTKLYLAAAAAAALCAAAPALAFAQQAPDTTSPDGAYGNLGWSHVTTDGASTEGIQGRLGYRFMPFLGVEGELRGGLSTGNSDLSYTTGTPPVTTNVNTGIKQTVDGAGYVVGFLPLMPNRFDLLARVGYGWSHYDLSPSGQTSFGSNEHGIRYGVGAQYLFDGANGVRVDWTREHMNDFTVPVSFDVDHAANVWGVSFVHKF
jgi:opacity protein-like surface antigen